MNRKIKISRRKINITINKERKQKENEDLITEKFRYEVVDNANYFICSKGDIKMYSRESIEQIPQSNIETNLIV
jgi:hypothetical protein